MPVVRASTPASGVHAAGSAHVASTNQRQPDKRCVLSRDRATEVYNRAGASIKDSSSVYGGPATDALIQAAALESAVVVFEFGSGSGGLAERLLSTVLHPQCMYHAVDQSPVQVKLAQQRLSQFGKRAEVQQCCGSPKEAADHLPDGSVDAVISTYVLDILSDHDIEDVLCTADRLLCPGGKLCLVGLTYGDTPLSKLASGIWDIIFAVRPEVVGGCRPQDILPYLTPNWSVTTAQTIPGGLLRSQLVVAQKSH